MTQEFQRREAVIGHRHSRTGLLLHALCCLAVMLGLTWALLTPEPFAAVEGSGMGWVSNIDDIVLHAGSFCVLSLVVCSLVVRLAAALPFRCIVALVAYAVATELMQSAVPGRTCDPFDVLANLSGIMAGLMSVQAGFMFSTRLQHPGRRGVSA